MNTPHINRWDSLLAWLSLEESYSFATVKMASRRLSVLEGVNAESAPIIHARYWAGRLISLGHAEYDPTNHRVSAVSPGIVFSNNLNRAVLYGYWDPDLIRKFRSTGLHLQLHRPKRGPTCYSFRKPGHNIRTLCEEHDIWITNDNCPCLLSCLPSISSAMNQLSRSEVSAEGIWEVLSLSGLRFSWRNARDPFVNCGLYRRRSGSMLHVYVDANGGRFALKSKDERAFIKWDLAPKSDWLYDPPLKRLLIPYETPELPLLVSRGLTMYSARLPSIFEFAGRLWWNYVSVGEEEAHQVARVMEQDLKIRSLHNA